MFDILAVDADRAAVTVIKPGQQAGDGGFTGAGRTYQADSLSGFHYKGQVMNNFIAFIIGKRYMLKTYIASYSRKHPRIRLVLHLFRKIQYIKDTLRRRKRFLNISYNTGNPLDRI